MKITHLFFLFAISLCMHQAHAQSYEMDAINGTTVYTCSGTFFDSNNNPNYAGYYDLGESYQTTICADQVGQGIKVDFPWLWPYDVEDTLWVYDGSTATGTPIAVYSGYFTNQTVVGFSGCLTFVFSSSGGIVTEGWEGEISCFSYTPIQTQPACTNIGFESGDFSGWYGSYGVPVATYPGPIITGNPGDPHPSYFPDVFGQTLAPYHTITSGAGLDPNGGFPVVAPNGGNFSMRLGDGLNGDYGGASIEQQFDVTAANATMIYSYAAVIQDAGASAGTPHAPEEQPFFKIEAFDCNGDPIACGDYLVVGGPNISGFLPGPAGTEIYYKPWTDVFLDLTPYIGSCVNVRFTQGDCSLGAHMSYVYLDAQCAPLEITGPQWICPGESVTLEAPAGGSEYLWSPGGQTTQSITVSPSSLTNYSCTVTSVGGPTCVSTAYYWVDVYPPAQVSAQNDTICVGETASLAATPNTTGGSFSWNPSGLTSQSIDVSPSATTNYTVTYTDVNGCSADAPATVLVHPSPIVNAVPNETVCNGELTTPINFTGNPVGTTFDWINTNPLIGLAASGNGNIASFSAVNTGTTTQMGTITVTPTSPEGCVGSPISFTITVYPTPNVNPVNDVVVCNGDPVAGFNFSGATTGTTYTWMNSNTAIGLAASGSGNIPSFTAINTGGTAVTSTITITPTANGCTGPPTTFIITVNPTPTVDPILDQALCNGELSNAVTFSSPAAGAVFSWANSNTSIGLGGSGNGDIPAFSGVNSGTTPTVGTITVTATANGCTGSTNFTITINTAFDYYSTVEICEGDSALIHGSWETVSNTYTNQYVLPTGCDSISHVNLIVNPLPVINAGVDQTACFGTPITLNANGAPTIVWDDPTVTNGVPFTPSVGTNVYIATGIDANNCSSADTVEVVINPVPTVDPNQDQMLCAGASTNLVTMTGSLSGTTYTWTNSETGIGLAASGTGDIGSFIGQNTTGGALTGTIMVTPDNGLCIGTPEMFMITVNPLPIVEAGNNLTVCENETVLLTGSGAASYVWNNGITNGVSFLPNSGWYTVVGTDQNGCQNTDSLQIAVELNPIPTFEVTVSPCEPFHAVLTNTTPGDLVDCEWYISNGDNLSGCGTVNYTFPDPGTFDITLITTSASGCVGTTTEYGIVTLQPGPDASFTQTLMNLSSLNTHVEFTNTSTGASIYEWDFGDGTVNSNEVDPSHDFPDDGSANYVITLYASSDLGCVDTAYATVVVNEELIFYVPNTFTPDADDYNEYFKPVFTSGFDPYDFELLIFNRWGEVVWESHDASAGWDGTYAGQYRVQDGTYTWKITFKKSTNDKRIVVTGHVNILR